MDDLGLPLFSETSNWVDEQGIELSLIPKKFRQRREGCVEKVEKVGVRFGRAFGDVSGNSHQHQRGAG